MHKCPQLFPEPEVICALGMVGRGMNQRSQGAGVMVSRLQEEVQS